MMLSACGPETELVELADEHRAKEVELAANFDDAALSHLIVLSETVHRNLRSSAAPRAVFDAAVVRMAHLERFALAAGVVEQARLGAASSGRAGGRAEAGKA